MNHSRLVDNSTSDRLKGWVRRLTRKVGLDIIGFDPRFNQESRKRALLERFNILEVMDIGANKGQFGFYLRSIGFTGHIHSFEPIKSIFLQLEQASSRDEKWVVNNIGFGDHQATTQIHVSGNLVSSSLKMPLAAHTNVHPDSVITHTEEVNISTVSNYVNDVLLNCKQTMLKIDTQGFEMEVLEGCGVHLSEFPVVLLELSVKPLYEGQAVMSDLITYMYRSGFELAVLEPCDMDMNNLIILQLDGWFVRSSQLQLNNIG